MTEEEPKKEETQTKETPPEKTTPSPSQEEKSILDKAVEEKQALNSTLEEIKKERERLEKAAARIELQGRTLGSATPELSEDEKWEKSAKERYEGTGISPIPKKGSFE